MIEFPWPFFETIERDEAGRVLARGAKWFEFKADRFAKALMACVAAPFFAYPFLYEVFVEGDRVQSYHVAGVLMPAAVIAIGCWVMQREIRKRRSVIFHSDGGIETPHGFLGNDYAWGLIEQHGEILSIEAVQVQGAEFAVNVYMRSGEIYTLTRYLDQLNAHKVAVTLTNALRIVREAAARADALPSAAAIDQRVKAAMRGMKPGDHVRVVID